MDLSIVSFHFLVHKSSLRFAFTRIYANSARAKFKIFFFGPGRRLKILISDDDVRWSGLEKFGIEGRDTNREREFEKRKGEWMDEGERWNHGERACAISSVRAHGSLTKPMRPC